MRTLNLFVISFFLITTLSFAQSVDKGIMNVDTSGVPVTITSMQNSQLLYHDFPKLNSRIYQPLLAPSNSNLGDDYHNSYNVNNPAALYYYKPEGRNFLIEYNNVTDIRKSNFTIIWDDKK